MPGKKFSLVKKKSWNIFLLMLINLEIFRQLLFERVGASVKVEKKPLDYVFR